MSQKKTMTKRAARKWVRDHWAYYISAADPPDDAFASGQEVIGEVWTEECSRIARKIRGAEKS